MQCDRSCLQGRGDGVGSNNTKGINKANPEKVVNPLSNFQSREMTFGNQQFLLDKKGMKHILERHHPDIGMELLKRAKRFLIKTYRLMIWQILY